LDGRRLRRKITVKRDPASPYPIEPALLRLCEELFSLSLSEKQGLQLQCYVDLFLHWNSKINLMARQELRDLLQFHFFESFWLADRFLKDDSKVADIGSGAGFPGLAMLVVRPGISLTLIEKVFKKTMFLKEVSRSLRFPTVQVFNGVAEEYSQWEGTQVATLRALKPNPAILHLLDQAGCKLLCLHGTETHSSLHNSRLIKRLEVPGSRDRWASLFDPRG
jgi:16S rRNA (guanine527-N7)-methyltransferase